MATLPLALHNTGALLLPVKVQYHNKVTVQTFPFVLDTGAARTIILPHYQKVLADELGPLSLGPPDEIETLFGRVSFQPVQGIQLVAATASGKEKTLQIPYICVAKKNTQLAQSKLRYNLLGRNVLEKLALYVDRLGKKFVDSGRKRPLAFLTDHGDAINGWLRWIPPGQAPLPGSVPSARRPLFEDFFAPPTTPTQPGPVHWIPDPGKAPRL